MITLEQYFFILYPMLWNYIECTGETLDRVGIQGFAGFDNLGDFILSKEIQIGNYFFLCQNPFKPVAILLLDDSGTVVGGMIRGDINDEFYYKGKHILEYPNISQYSYEDIISFRSQNLDKINGKFPFPIFS